MTGAFLEEYLEQTEEIITTLDINQISGGKKTI